MSKHAHRGWLRSLLTRPRTLRRRDVVRLNLEQFEERDCPSNSILLNHVDPTTQIPLTPDWTAIGPAPQLRTVGNLPASGRASGVAVDPTNANRIFATAASGGIWRSLDGGVTWTPLTLHLPGIPDAARTLNMGAIAIAPSDPNTIYAAEGEGDTLSQGFGVLKSTDGGNTWTLTGLGQFGFGLTADSIVIDNLDPNIAFVNNEAGGVFRTLNGGTTWTDIATSAVFGGSSQFTDVDIAPRVSLASPVVLYTAIGDKSVNGGIYRSVNANDPVAANVTWNLSIGGSTLVPGAGPGNITMVVSQQFPSLLYAAIADNNNAGEGLLGVYRSNDSGTNWARILAAPNYLGNQAAYDNVITVSPFDPNVVFVAGQTQILQSQNANAGNPNSVVFTDVTTVNGTSPHVDFHASAFDPNGNLIIGCDGGVYRLTLAGNTTPVIWGSLNGNNAANPVVTSLNTIQFNGISLDPRDPNIAFGGSQDNGLGRFNDNVGWNGVDTFADSGDVIVDFNNPLRVVHTTQGPLANNIRVSSDGGLTWVNASTQPSHTAQNTLFYPPLLEDPSVSARFFFGSDALSISQDGGVTWGTTYTFPSGSQNIPGDPSTGLTPTPSPITAIGVGRASGSAGVLYAAHTNGTLYRLVFFPPPATGPATTDWINIAPTGAAAVGVVTQIIVDPQNPQNVYVVGGAGIARTQDALSGAPTWTLISGSPVTGGLPGFFGPDTIALDPKNFSDTTDDVLYVGGTYGVYQLVNPGHAGPGGPGGSDFVWTQVGGSYNSDPTNPLTFRRGLPDVQVTQLNLNTTTGILAAGTYGAGLWELQIRGLIRGEVFQDTNGNGLLDAGEAGMANVVVRLINADTNVEIANTTTDANGFYAFRSLTSSQLTATNYIVQEVTPAGQITTTAPLTFSNLTEQSTYDVADPNLNTSAVVIGNFVPGSISGTKFEDRNGNGVRDAGEPGVAGFTIFIDLNNTGVFAPGDPSTSTAANGSWSFTNLGPAVINGLPNPNTYNGAYIIREIQKNGWVQTTAPFAPFTLTSGQNVTGQLIGNEQTGSISGTKFIDLNGDGVREPGEPGGANFTIQISGPGGIRTTTTAADGTYSFLSLGPGTYTVTEVVPAGFTNTRKPGLVTVTTGVATGGVDFGNFQNVSVTGTKFNDLNGNGIFDGGEPGLAGFVFDLINTASNAVVAQATSGVNGAFTFLNVGPPAAGGQYVVREEQQPGFVQTTANPPAFSITSGTAPAAQVFGNFQIAATAVSGVAYIDLNQNGVRDAGEPGAFDFKVNLYNNGILVGQTTTAVDGSFSFVGLGPGNYFAAEVVRNGYLLGQGAAGYPVTATSGTVVGPLLFGDLITPTEVTARSSGPSTITVKNGATQQVLSVFNAYAPSFTGGVRVATGYIQTGQAVPNVITAPGPGGGPDIRVFNGSSGQLVAEFLAYDINMTNGVYIATGDINGDGVTDIITGADAGGGSHVKVFDGAALRAGVVKVDNQFFAYDASFHGGVRVASADVDADGFDDIVTGAGPGGGPHVEVFSGRTGQLIESFFAYGSFTGGVFVAAADVNGDHFADIITGPGQGGGPDLKVFNGATNGALLAESFPFPISTGGQFNPSFWTSGLRVAVMDFNRDGRPDIIVSAGGTGQPPVLQIVDGLSLAPLYPPTAQYDPSYLGGIFIAGN
jgi:hypothetical protein